MHYQPAGLTFKIFLSHSVFLFHNQVKHSSHFAPVHLESAIPALPTTLRISSKLSSKQEDNSVCKSHVTWVFFADIAMLSLSLKVYGDLHAEKGVGDIIEKGLFTCKFPLNCTINFSKERKSYNNVKCTFGNETLVVDM